MCSKLARLILVDVIWSEWDPEKDRSHYEDFIKLFLCGSSGDSGDSGPVYMHQCYPEDANSGIHAEPWVVQSAPYELPPKHQCRSPDCWLDGEEALDRVTSVPETEWVSEGSEASIHKVRDWGTLFRTRLYMHSRSYRAAINGPGKSDSWVLIDMRFQRLPDGSVIWHTLVSFWSDPPRCGHHCPERARKWKLENPKVQNFVKLMGDWHEDMDALWNHEEIRKNADRDPRESMRVRRRIYGAPSFLVAVPGRPDDDMATAADQPSVLQQVSNEILWTRNYESLPTALLKGGVKAFRRFLPYQDDDYPRYLLIPDTQTHADDAGAWYETQEEAAAVGVLILTDLEAYAASELGGISSRMEIRENHLKIYQSVAGQAGALWDALARLLLDAKETRFLPGAKKRGLDLVHRSIEMIHGTLLQGVADLDQLARDINGAQSHIESTADEVADRFDHQLHHPSSSPGGVPLRDSLRGGPLDRLRRQVREASSDAARVSESYRMLLASIGMAFDERRVREGDQLQRASVWLVVAFGVLGLAGVAQATLPLPQLTSHDPKIFYIKWFLWLVTAAVILAMILLLLNPRVRGQIATPGFEKHYTKVRDFLAEASTDHLDDFRREINGKSPEERRPPLTSVVADYPKSWQDLDRRLSESFVEAWRIASESYTSTKIHPYKATGLRLRVEAWTLRTLMLTERPRNFGRYQLPYLTSLYRICTANALNDWPVVDETHKPYSAVGKTELAEALGRNSEWLLNEVRDHHIDIKEPANEVYGWLKHNAPWAKLGNPNTVVAVSIPSVPPET
jgi:hypothetical protein